VLSPAVVVVVRIDHKLTNVVTFQRGVSLALFLGPARRSELGIEGEKAKHKEC